MNLAGINSTALVMRLNTLYSGSCFAILPTQNVTSEIQTHKKKIPHINLNLKGNASTVNMYLLPQKSINAMILDEWHYPVKKFKLQNLKFVETVLKKMYYIKRPTKEIPCTDMAEEAFYEVNTAQ